jgi:hypothetical protein
VQPGPPPPPASTPTPASTRPNRYANLRGAFQHAVYLDRELWEYFGSAEKVVEALRLLVDLARREVTSPGERPSAPV